MGDAGCLRLRVRITAHLPPPVNQFLLHQTLLRDGVHNKPFGRPVLPAAGIAATPLHALCRSGLSSHCPGRVASPGAQPHFRSAYHSIILRSILAPDSPFCPMNDSARWPSATMAGTTQASPFKPQSWRLVWEPVHEDNAFFEGDRDTDDNHATTITHGFENRHNLHHDAIPTPEHGILSNITPALYAFTSATTPNPIVPGFSRSSSINTSASLVANNRDQGPSRPPLFQPANRTIPTTRRHQPTLQPPAPQFNTYERFASNPSMDYVAHAENPRQSYSRGPGSTDGSSSGSVSCGSSNISNDDATASPDTAYDGPAGGSFGPSVTNEKDNLGNWLDNGAVPQDQVYLGLGQATNTFSQQDWAQQQPSHLELGSFGGGNRITRMDQPYLWGTQVASAPQPRQFMTPQPRRDLFADPGANGNYITIQNLPLIGNAGVVAGLPGDLAPVTSFGSFDEALSPTANSHPARSLQQQEQQGTPPLMPNSLSPLSTTARNPSTVQSPLHNDRNFNSSALSHRQFNGSLNDTTATDYSKPQNLATNAAGSVIFSQATDYAADEADSFYPFPNYNNSYDSANSYGSVSSYDGSLEKMVEDAMVAACIEAPAAPAAASAPAMVLPAIPYVNHPPPMMSHDDLMPLRDSVGLLTPGSCNDHAIDTGAPKHRIVPLNIDDGENDDNGDNDDNGRALTLIVEHGRKKLARPSVTPAPPRQSQSGRKRGRPPAEVSVSAENTDCTPPCFRYMQTYICFVVRFPWFCSSSFKHHSTSVSVNRVYEPPLMIFSARDTQRVF